MSKIFEEIANGEGVSLRELALQSGPMVGGKPIGLSTMLRWVKEGVCPAKHNVKLEAVRIGSRWVSTVAALKRMIAIQNSKSQREKVPA